MRREMKLRHTITIEEISKPKKVKLEPIKRDDDGTN